MMLGFILINLEYTTYTELESRPDSAVSVSYEHFAVQKCIGEAGHEETPPGCRRKVRQIVRLGTGGLWECMDE